jgi:hypothetical protein
MFHHEQKMAKINFDKPVQSASLLVEDMWSLTGRTKQRSGISTMQLFVEREKGKNVASREHTARGPEASPVGSGYQAQRERAGREKKSAYVFGKTTFQRSVCFSAACSAFRDHTWHDHLILLPGPLTRSAGFPSSFC